MMNVFMWLWIKLYINLIGAWKCFHDNVIDRHRKAKDLPNGDGQNIVITGGNRGIGLEAVKTFLKLGYNVIIGCRNPTKCESELNELKSEDQLGDGTFQCLELDLMSLQSVRKFAKEILDMKIPIHILVNNAGIMMCPRRETQDGLETQFGVNYASHFLLTSLLMPRLIEAGLKGPKMARIVNVSSVAHRLGQWMDLEDLNWKRNCYSREAAYGNSKAAQVLFSNCLQRKLSDKSLNVTVNSIHPGVVKTDLYKHVWYSRAIAGFLMKSPKQGADTILHAALDSDLEGKGALYMENSQVTNPASFAHNVQMQDKLWQETIKMLNMESFM